MRGSGRPYISALVVCRQAASARVRHHVLGVGNVNKAVLVGAVLKEVAVVASLLGSLGVKGIDLLPVLSARAVLVDQRADGRVLAFAGGELVEEDGAEEAGDGDDGTLL